EDKDQVTGAILHGNTPNARLCSHRPANGKFPLACQVAIATNFEDEHVVEHFFQLAIQTDYLHRKLEPRIVALIDPSWVFAFQTSFNYRLTDYLIANMTFIGIEGSRKYGVGVFRDRDQFQLKLTYQLN